MVIDCKKYAEVGVDVGGVGTNNTVALFLDMACCYLYKSAT